MADELDTGTNDASEYDDAFNEEDGIEEGSEDSDKAKADTKEDDADDADKKDPEGEDKPVDDKDDSAGSDADAKDGKDADKDGDKDDKDEGESEDTIVAKAEKEGKSLLQKLKDALTGNKDDQEEDDPPPVKAPEKKELSSKTAVPTDDEIKEFFDNMTDGKEKDEFKEFLEDYPMAVKTMMAINKGKSAQNSEVSDIIKKLSEQTERLEAQNAELNRDVKLNSLFTELQDRGHTDARKIARSEAFVKWVGEQSEGMKALATSWEVDHAELVYKAFKESQAGKTKDTHKEQKKIEKKKTDDLLKSSATPGKAAVKKTGEPESSKDDVSEFEKEFNSAED